MKLSVDRKKSLIEQFKVHDGDTGSPEVQIALLSERINGLAVVVRGYLHMVGELAGDQWNEGDVSCSVVRLHAASCARRWHHFVGRPQRELFLRVASVDLEPLHEFDRVFVDLSKFIAKALGQCRID